MGNKNNHGHFGKNGIPSVNIPFQTTHGFFMLCKHIFKYTTKKQIGALQVGLKTIPSSTYVIYVSQ
jgi:hypothetical protein